VFFGKLTRRAQHMGGFKRSQAFVKHALAKKRRVRARAVRAGGRAALAPSVFLAQASSPALKKRSRGLCAVLATCARPPLRINKALTNPSGPLTFAVSRLRILQKIREFSAFFAESGQIFPQTEQ